jgi:hypothetical protein
MDRELLPSVGCFSQIGLAAVVGSGAVALCVLTLLFPPWVKERADWRETGFGFGSEKLKAYESHFVGYHFMFSESMRETERRLPHTPGASIELTSYHPLRSVVAAEWIAVWTVASIVFVVESRRLQVRAKPE